MNEEIRNTISASYVHLRQIETFLEIGQPNKAEFRARELKEQAHLLANALYRITRTSGEVRGG
jgi:hypothetical protein